MKFRVRSLLTQFSLRDLFWLMVVVAVASYGHRNQRAMEKEVAAKKEEYKAGIAAAVEAERHHRQLEDNLEEYVKQEIAKQFEELEKYRRSAEARSCGGYIARIFRHANQQAVTNDSQNSARLLSSSSISCNCGPAQNPERKLYTSSAVSPSCSSDPPTARGDVYKLAHRVPLAD